MLESKLVSSPLTFHISNDLKARIYHDTRPHNLEIKGLHKGLVLVHEGREIVGEGAGLGVPVVKYSDKTFFPGTAEVSISSVSDESPPIITKTFTLDMVSRKGLRDGSYINDSLYHAIHKMFTRLYIPNKPLRPFFEKLMELRGVLGIHTEFIKTTSRGKVIIIYKLRHDGINIEVDLSNIDQRRCEEIILLNEQGSTFFTVYRDSMGLELTGRDIGPWDEVKADRASLSNGDRSLAFSLGVTSGVTLYRGWEQVEGRLAWAGLNYSVKPELPSFSYEIRIEIRERAD
jgi:hypothetical protein